MDIDKALRDMKREPQTYRTILGEFFTNKTDVRALRRKLNSLCKFGVLYRTIVPGSQYCKIMFYPKTRKYIILFVGGALFCDAYYGTGYTEDELSVTLTGCHVLKGDAWVRLDDTRFDKERILKVI